MTVAQAMANAQAVTGQVFDAATLRRWLSELDGQIALDLYRADAWTPYSADDDASAAGAVPLGRAVCASSGGDDLLLQRGV